jgi:hypothetical protein
MKTIKKHQEKQRETVVRCFDTAIPAKSKANFNAVAQSGVGIPRNDIKTS